ncbi:MAG: L-ribulose-5-phosphate 4-epimerase [Ignavibacteria bacterium RBG_13_36_8]|nr:MAG: L-ribulose-5-phosphate 4-epimerase [Ignavibacteria bacterium RBG_13_36_8]
MLEKLKEEVFKANIELVNLGLVSLTWGNVSGISRAEGLIVIKPSGLDYKSMEISDMVVIDLAGKVVEGNSKPSSDSATHIELYKAFPDIGGVTHTHSTYATIFAQACKEIPCLGTTHADHFCGTIPVTRFLSPEEVEYDYEKNTGTVIIERFTGLNPASMPGILVAGHAPFCWGRTPFEAVKNSLILEQVARMALGTFQINPAAKELPEHILKKHYQRKHGPNSYYGQK